MNETVGATLGAALRAAREGAGLEIEDVSAYTRLRATVIRDLEADRVESSGGAVYARGHVKSICAAVKVDPAPYLAIATRQLGAEPLLQTTLPEPRRASAEHLQVPTAARPERRGPNWGAAGAAALAVLVALFVIGQLSRPVSPVAEEAAPTPAPVASAPAAKPAPARNVAAALPVPTNAQLRVRILRGDSWISVRNGAQTLFEGVLRSGTVREFRDAKQLRLIVGNAGAVDLVCSGRGLGPAGRPGAVLRFTCSPQGLVRT